MSALRVMEKDSPPSSAPSVESQSITSDKERALQTKKWLISVVVVIGVAAAWVSSTQFSKRALLLDPSKFFAPYFMLWLNTCWMMTCFPIFCLYNLVRRVPPRQSLSDSLPVMGDSVCSGLFRVGLFLFLWTGANYTYLRALGHVSASVATSISSVNTAMVYVLALFLLGDRLVIPKILSILFAVGGVVLISLDGKIFAEWLGIMLAVVSAVFSATYKVMFKRILGDATLGQVSLFMTSLGLLNLVINVFPAFILILTGVEHAEFASAPWLPILASGLLNLLFNFLVNFGIALLHPLVISVGMLVGLPANTVFDIIFNSMQASVYFITGTVSVLVSFVLIIFPYALVPFCRRFVPSG